MNKLLNNSINKKNKTLQDELTLSQFLNGSVQLAGTPLNTFFSFKYAGLDSEGKPTFKELEEERAEELDAKYTNIDKEDVWLAVLDESELGFLLSRRFNNYFAYRNLVCL